MKKISIIFSFCLVGLLSMHFTSPHPSTNWEHLGSRKVNYRVDKDVIRVGAHEGGFTKLKIKVSHGSLNMHRMIVEYGNGSKDVVPLKFQFRRGSDTRVIDLKKGKRIIKDITFWYDSKSFSRHRATVHVFGRH